MKKQLNQITDEQQVPADFNPTEGSYHEMPICYVVQFPEDEEKPDGKILWSGYIRHFLSKERGEELKINGPLVATTWLEMPFETLEFCLYAMMNLLRTTTIFYTEQVEKELVEKNLGLKLIQVDREDITAVIEEQIKSGLGMSPESN